MKKTAPKATLSDNLCEQIKNDVMRRNLLPGQKINLKELAARYGVSETPLRIALNRLISENIVENFPRQGMRFKPINIESCRETFELRKVIETYYADKMIHVYSVDSQFRANLNDNVQKHLEVVQKLSEDFSFEYYLKHYELDGKFHDMLISCSESTLIMSTYKNCNPFQYANYVYGKQTIDRLRTGVYEHLDIIEALKSGDPDAVKEKIVVHMDKGSDSIISILKWDDFNSRLQESE